MSVDSSRGRPPGSKNREYLTAHEHKARCPKCGSTERRCAGSPTRTAYSGVDSDGHEFTEIRRQRCECVSCGQFFIVVSRLFEPEF